MKKYRSTFFLGALLVFSIALLYVSFNYFIELSAFAVVQAMVAGLLIEYVLIDKFILKEYDTLKTLFKDPVGVGLALVALAILFHACTSFV